MQDGKFSSIPNISPIDVFRELRAKNLVEIAPFVKEKTLNPYSQNWVNNYEILKNSKEPEIIQALEKKQQELIEKGVLPEGTNNLDSLKGLILDGMYDDQEIPTFKGFQDWDTDKIKSKIEERQQQLKDDKDKITVPAHLTKDYEKSFQETFKDYDKLTPEDQKRRETAFRAYWKVRSHDEIHGKNSNYSRLLDEDYGRNNITADAYGNQKITRAPIDPKYLHNNMNDLFFGNKKTKLWYEIESFVDTYNKAFNKNEQLSEDFDENIELYKKLYPEYKKLKGTSKGQDFDLLMGEKYFQDGLAQKKQSEFVRESPDVLERVAKLPLGGFLGEIVHEFMNLEDIGKSLYKGAQNTVLFNWVNNVLVDKYDPKDLPNEYFLSKIDPKGIADRIKDDPKLAKELDKSPDVGFGSRLFFKKMAEIAVENVPTMAEFILMNKAMGLAGKMTTNWAGGIRGAIGKSLSSARYLEQALPMSEFMLKNGKGVWKYLAEVGKRAGAGFVVGAQTLGTTNLYRNLYNDRIFEANDDGTVNRNQAVADIIYNVVSGGMENLSENIFFMPYLKGGKVLNGFAKQLEKNIFASVMSEVLEEEITNITDDYYQQFVKDKYQTTALVTKPFRDDPQWENTYIQLGTALSTFMLAQTMGKFSKRQENAFYAKFGQEIKPLLEKYLTKETLESKMQSMVTKFEQLVPAETQIAFKQANQSNQFMYGAYQQGKGIVEELESIQNLPDEEFDNAKVAFESKYNVPLDESFSKLKQVENESSFVKRLYLGTSSDMPTNVQEYLGDIKNLHSLQDTFNQSIVDQELGLKDLIEENLDKILESNPDKETIKKEFVQKYFFDNVMDSPSVWLGELTTDSKTNVRLFALAKELNQINAVKAKTENEQEIETSKQFLENIKIEEKKANRKKRDTSNSKKRVKEIDNEISTLQSQIDSSTGKSKKGIKETKDRIDNLFSEKYELESEINQNLTIDEQIAKLESDRFVNARYVDQTTMDNYETEINNLKEEKRRNQNKKKEIAETKKNLEQRIAELQEENSMLDNLETYYEQKDNVKDQIKASRLLMYHFKDIESTILEDYPTLKEALRTLTGVQLSKKEFWRAKWNSGARNGREAYLFLKKALEKYAEKTEVDFKDIELFNTIRQVVEQIDKERALQFGIEEEKNDKYQTIITEKWKSYFKGDIDAIDRMIQHNLREAFNYHNHKAKLSFNPELYKEVLDMISKEDFDDWSLLESYLFELGTTELAEISFRLKALNNIKFEKSEPVSSPIIEEEVLPTGVEDKEEKSTNLSHTTNVLDKETGRPLVFIQYLDKFLNEYEVKTEKGYERFKGQLAIPLRKLLFSDLQRKQIEKIILTLFEDSNLPKTEGYKKFIDLFIKSVLSQELINKSELPKNLASDDENSKDFLNVMQFVRVSNEILIEFVYNKLNLEDVTATAVIAGEQYATKSPVSVLKPFISNPVALYLYYKDLFDSTKTLPTYDYAPQHLAPIKEKMNNLLKDITQTTVTITPTMPVEAPNSLVEPQTIQKGSEVLSQENKASQFPKWTNPDPKKPTISFTSKVKMNSQDGIQTITFEKIIKKQDGTEGKVTKPSIQYDTLEDFLEDFEIEGEQSILSFEETINSEQSTKKNIKVREIRYDSNTNKAAIDIVWEMKFEDGTISNVNAEIAVKPKQGIIDKVQSTQEIIIQEETPVVESIEIPTSLIEVDFKDKANEIPSQNASNNAQEASQDTNSEKTTKSMPTEEIVPPKSVEEELPKNVLKDFEELDTLYKEIKNLGVDIKSLTLKERTELARSFENFIKKFLDSFKDLPIDVKTSDSFLEKYDRIRFLVGVINKEYRLLFPNLYSNFMQVEKRITDLENASNTSLQPQGGTNADEGIVSTPVVKKVDIIKDQEKIDDVENDESEVGNLEVEGLINKIKGNQKIEERIKSYFINVLTRYQNGTLDLQKETTIDYTLNELKSFRVVLTMIENSKAMQDGIWMFHDLIARYFKMIKDSGYVYLNYKSLPLLIDVPIEDKDLDLVSKLASVRINETVNDWQKKFSELPKYIAESLNKQTGKGKGNSQKDGFYDYYEHTDYSAEAIVNYGRFNKYSPMVSIEGKRLIGAIRIANKNYEDNFWNQLYRDKIYTYFIEFLKTGSQEEKLKFLDLEVNSEDYSDTVLNFIQFAKIIIRNNDQIVPEKRVEDFLKLTNVKIIPLDSNLSQEKFFEYIKKFEKQQFRQNGIYSKDTNSMLIIDKERTFLHELIHSVSLNTINRDYTSNLQTTLNDIKEVIKGTEFSLLLQDPYSLEEEIIAYAFTNEKFALMLQKKKSTHEYTKYPDNLFKQLLNDIFDWVIQKIDSKDIFENENLLEQLKNEWVENLTNKVSTPVNQTDESVPNNIDNLIEEFLQEFPQYANQLFIDDVKEQFRIFNELTKEVGQHDDFHNRMEFSSLTEYSDLSRVVDSTILSQDKIDDINAFIVPYADEYAFDPALQGRYTDELTIDYLKMAQIFDKFKILFDISFDETDYHNWFRKIGLDGFLKAIAKPSDKLKESDPDLYAQKLEFYEIFDKMIEDGINYHKVIGNPPKWKLKALAKRAFYQRYASSSYHRIYEVAVVEKKTTAQEEGEDVEIRYSAPQIRNIEKTKTAGGEYHTSDRPNLKIDREYKDPVIDLINQTFSFLGENLITGIETEYIVSFFGEHLGESRNKSLKEHIAQGLKYGETKGNQKKIQEQNKNDVSSEALGAIRQIYYQAGGLIFLNKFGEKNHYPCYRLKFNENIKAEVKEKYDLTHNDIFFDHFIFPLYKFYRAEGIKYLVNKNYIQAGLLNDDIVQQYQKDNQIEDFQKAKEMLYEEYSKNESRNFLSDEDFEGVETSGMLFNAKTGKEELTTYKKYGNNKPVATSLVLRILAEEFKLQNNPSNFFFYMEDGVKKVEVNSLLFNRNMIELMKRATPVLEQMPIAYTVDDLVIPEISKYLTRSNTRINLEQKGRGNSIFLWQDDKLYFKTVFMDTKNIPDELKPYFYNKYGQFRYDGASFVLRGVFDTAYAKLAGALNESTAKNVILWKNLFIKHAVHAVAENDPLGKWMMDNRVGMLVFDEGEKNKVLLNHQNGETTESLLYNSKGQPIPYKEQKIGFLKNNITTLNDPEMVKQMISYYIPFEAISRIGEKFSNTKEVKALQQFINSSGISERNKAIKNSKILQHFAKYAKTFADEINAKVLPDAEGNETHIKRGILTYLKRIMESPTKGLQSELTIVFPQLLQMMKELDSDGNPVYTIDEQFEYLKILMNFDMVNDLVQNFMNDFVQDAVAYQDRGRQLTLCPDLGNQLGQSRVNYAISQIQEELSEDKAAKFIEKAFDKNGFLNRDYVFISGEIAKDFGLKVGDKFITTIIPSAGGMESKGVIIAGILPTTMVSPNSIIMNSEYVQGIGRDYDIDVLNAVFYNAERWKDIGGEKAYLELVDALMDVEKDYVEDIYDEFERTGVDFEKAKQDVNDFYQGIMEEDKNYLDSLPSLDRKMAIAFNNDVMTDYQIKFLGKSDKIKRFYAPAEYTNMALADVYRKDVGFVIVLRALHQFLTKKGMKFDYTVKEADIKDENGKVIKEGTVHNLKCDLTDKSWWFKVHISLMIATQHQVDYPKNISKDFYDGSPASFFAKMIGLTIPFSSLSEKDQKAITEFYEIVRQKIIPALRIPKYVQKKGETLASDKSKFNALIDKGVKFQKLDEKTQNITKTFEKTSFFKNNIKNSEVTYDESSAPQPYHEFVNGLDIDAMSKVNDFVKRTVRNNHVVTKNVESMIHLDLISRQQPNLISPRDINTFRSNLGAMFKVAYKLNGQGQLNELPNVTQEIDIRGAYQIANIPLLPNHYVKPMVGAVENFTGFALQNSYEIVSGQRFNINPRTAPEPNAPLWNLFMKSVRRGYKSLMQETIKNLKITKAIDTNPAQQRFELALFYGLPVKLGMEMFRQGMIALPNSRSSNQRAYRLISSMDSENKQKSLIQKYTALYNKGKDSKEYKMPYQLLETEEFFKFVLESPEFSNISQSNYKQYVEHYENPKLGNVAAFYHTLFGVNENIYKNNNSMILQAPQIQYYLMDSGLLPPMDIFNSEFVFGLYNSLMSDAAKNSTTEGMDDLYKSLSIVLFTTAFVSGRREYVEEKAVDETGDKVGKVKGKYVRAYGLKELQDKTKQTLVYSELISEQVYALFKRKNIVLEKDLLGEDSLLYTDSDGNKYVLSVKSVFTHNEQNELQSDVTFIIQKNNENPVIKEGTLVKTDLFSEILTQSDFFNDEENRLKISKAINLTNEVNFGLTDRIESATKVLPKVMTALELYDPINKKPTEKGQEILDMALTWLMGYAESIAKTDMSSNLMTMNLYIPGVLIDNRVLWSIIARWSPTLHKEYMAKFTEILLDKNLSDRLNEITETKTDLRQLTAYERKVKANRQAYRRFKTKVSVKDGINNEESEVGEENGLEDMIETTNEFSSYWMFDMKGVDKLSYDATDDKLIENSFKKVVKVAEELNQAKYDVVVKGREKSLIQYLSNENVTFDQALNWLQNNFKFSSVLKNRQGVIKNIKDTRTQFQMINMMYIDLQRIKRSITNPKEIKGKMFGLLGDASKRRSYLMSMARTHEVLNFNIFDNPLDLDKIIVTRTFNLDRVSLPESAILQPNEKIKKADSEELKLEKEAIAEKKKLKRAEYFNEYYTIDMNVANILSKGVYAYNPDFSSIRPYGLFSLSYAKYQKTNQDIKVELKKVQEIISRLANMDPVGKRVTQGTKKILAGTQSLKSGSRYKKMQFQATAYAIADRLGYDSNFNVQFINSNSIEGGKIRIRYGDKTYEQKDVDDFTFLDELIKNPSFIFREGDESTIFTPEESYAVLFTAIELRRLFDVQLKNYIQRINYFMSQVSDDFLNNSLFYTQVAELRTKYFRLLQAFSGVRKTKAGEEEITDRKVTPKVYLSSKVKEIYVEQKFSVRYEYYLNKIAKKKFNNEKEKKELTELEGKSLKEKEMYVKGKLLEEITHKVGNDMFYVPLFNNEADDSLTDYIAQFQPLQNHVFERLFEQIESDINTVYYYQAKTFAIMNNLPKSHILFLEGWFSGISRSMGLKQLRVALSQVKQGQFIQFLTEDEGDYTTHYGEFVSFKNGELEVKIGDTVNTFSKIKASDYDSLEPKYYDNQVYIATEDWQERIERKANEGNLAYKALYHGFDYAFTKSFVALQMLGLRFLRSKIFNKFGAAKQISEFTRSSYYKRTPESILKQTVYNNSEFERALRYQLNAISSIGTSMIDSNISVTSNDIVSFSTRNSMLEDMLYFRMLMKKSPEYAEYIKFRDAKEAEIKVLQLDILKLQSTDEDRKTKSLNTKEKIRSIRYQIEAARGMIDIDLFKEMFSGTPQEVKKLKQEVGVFADKFQTRENIQELYGLDKNTLIKMMSLYGLRRLFTLGFTQVQSIEAEMRALGAMRFLEDAHVYGVKEDKDLLAWMQRGSELTNVLYNQGARRANSSGFVSRFTYLLGHYTHTVVLHLLQALDELGLQRLNWQLKNLYNVSLDTIILDSKDAIKQGRKGSKVIGGNAFAKLFKLLWINTTLSNIAYTISGLNFMVHPALAPIFMLIQLSFKAGDDDESLYLSDILFLINNIMSYRFGMGASFTVNALFNNYTDYVTDKWSIGRSLLSLLNNPANVRSINKVINSNSMDITDLPNQMIDREAEIVYLNNATKIFTGLGYGRYPFDKGTSQFEGNNQILPVLGTIAGTFVIPFFPELKEAFSDTNLEKIKAQKYESIIKNSGVRKANYFLNQQDRIKIK